MVVPVNVGGKLAYIAFKDKKSFIVYNGKEIGKEYDNVEKPIDINGKLAYIATKDKKRFVVMEK